MSRIGRLVVVLLVACGGACRSSRGLGGGDEGRGTSAGLVEVFAHVRLDRVAGIVEFDGMVPIDCHDQRTPDVWLEQIVCLRDTKEHESLVMSHAKASDIHAALLMLGLTPGEPGSYVWDGQRVVGVAPRGDPVVVTFVYEDVDGVEVSVDPMTWVIDADRRRTLFETIDGDEGFVFAGSRFVSYNGPEVYDADLSGTLIGLATFGGETIAFSRVISPEASIEEPAWLANGETVPAYGTAVRVRISPAGVASGR